MNLLLPAIAFFLLLFSAAAQNSAPSSHMVYNDANFDGDILINEVRVPKAGEAMYTYYEALGWGGRASGYAGIQAHPKAHNYIFSIWDNKSHTAPIKAVYHDPGTRIEKFGGEGTGLKSWNFELGWDTDVWYTLVSRCWPVGDHTYYGYWVRSGKTGQWTHLVTMDVATKNAYFRGGNDSFIEDWVNSGKNARTVHLREGWKRKPNGQWHAFGAARYSVNAWDLTEGKRSFNYKTNWDGGVAKDASGAYYFMTAGGRETKPSTANPSKFSIPRNEKTPGYAAIKIQSVKMRAVGKGKFVVSWEIDPKTLPQYSFSITGPDDGDGATGPLVVKREVEPQARTVELSLHEHLDPQKLHWRLSCHDILGNKSESIPLVLTK